MASRMTPFLTLLILGSIAPVAAQPDALRYNESRGKPPAAAASADSTARSAPLAISSGPFVSVQVNLDANGANIVGDAANEPSLAIDPTDPGKIVIGWRQFDTIASDFRQAGWSNSVDGGASWIFRGVVEPGVFRSDPVVAADSQGRFYYQSLRDDFSVQVFRSDDGGATWLPPVPAFGGDKNWITIDRSGGPGEGFVHQSYSFTLRIGENCRECVGEECVDGELDVECVDEICCFGDFCCDMGTYVRSTDRGDSYEPPKAYAFDDFFINFSFGKTLTVGLDGELYVAGDTWRDATFDDQYTALYRSDDAPFATLEPTFSISEIDLGGDLTGFAGPNPNGFMGQIWLDVDRSAGPNRGALYAMATVDPEGDDPMDAMFARSDDQGRTFSPPVRINDDPVESLAWQWFGAIAVAPNGRIDTIWNDTRNGGSERISQLFYSYSVDGGATWSANVPVTPPWDSHVGFPDRQLKIGDYYDIVSETETAAVAYAATFNGEQDIYFTRVFPDCNENAVPDARDISSGSSSDLNANLVPDDCEPMVLGVPTPGLAGGFNTLTLTGAVPGHRVRLYRSSELGDAIVPDCEDAELRADIVAPENRRMKRAGADGTALFEIQVPAETAGHTVHYQAVDVDTCAAKSEPVTITYQ